MWATGGHAISAPERLINAHVRDAHYRLLETTEGEFAEWEMCNGRWGLEPEKSCLLLDSVYYRWYASRPLQPEECDNINYESIQELNRLDESEKKKKYKNS